MEILGLDLSDPSLAKTPARIAKMYAEEIFWGLDHNNFPQLTFQKEETPNELVVIKNISFVSFCEHHFVPIVGKAHVAYYPEGKIMGLSKVHQIVRYFAKRPQLQERLTQQIADTLSEALETEEIGVSIQAVHFCVIARGVEDHSAEVETRILKGEGIKKVWGRW